MRLVLAALFLPLLCTSLCLAEESPRQQMDVTISKLVQIVAEYPEDSQTDKRREKLREIIAPKFDFEEMSKRSLGVHWNRISPEEQEDFVDAFSELLARTYRSRIESVRENMVTVDSEKIVGANSTIPKALVKTTVTYEGDTFPIDYKMFKNSAGWKVYDVVIENIGLVANYRNEFSGIIRREKFSGLLKKLQKKAGMQS